MTRRVSSGGGGMKRPQIFEGLMENREGVGEGPRKEDDDVRPADNYFKNEQHMNASLRSIQHRDLVSSKLL